MSDYSVPDAKGIVKQAFKTILSGFHLRGDGMGIDEISDSMSGEEMFDMFKALLSAGASATKSSKLMVGDAYNILGRSRKAQRRQVLQRVVELFGENQRQQIRICGWVANKWPRETRGEHTWTYMLRNTPSTGVPSRTPRVPTYEAKSSREVEGGIVCYVEGPNGRPMNVFLPEPLTHPQRDDRYRYDFAIEEVEGDREMAAA